MLKRVLKTQPDQSVLRLRLTELCNRGDTGELLLQIEELKRLGYSQVLTQYYKSRYYINGHQFLQAKQILATLHAQMKKRDIAVQFKSTIKLLLARCYKELGEPEMEQELYRQALMPNRKTWKPDLVGSRI